MHALFQNTYGQLYNWCVSHRLTDTTGEHDVVCIHHVMAPEQRKVLVIISTKHLVRNLARSSVMISGGFVAMDATHKVTWNGLPALLMTTVSQHELKNLT